MTELESKLSEEKIDLRIKVKELENELKKWRNLKCTPEFIGLVMRTLQNIFDAGNSCRGKFDEEIRFYNEACKIINEWNHKKDMLVSLNLV